jgi:hypothetical protein
LPSSDDSGSGFTILRLDRTLLDHMASDLLAPATPHHDTFLPRNRSEANRVLAPVVGETALQTANPPTGRPFFRIHLFHPFENHEKSFPGILPPTTIAFFFVRDGFHFNRKLQKSGKTTSPEASGEDLRSPVPLDIMNEIDAAGRPKKRWKHCFDEKWGE